MREASRNKGVTSTYFIVMLCIFYYMRLHYLITTTKYDWMICFASFAVTIIGSLAMVLFKKKKLILREYLMLLFVVLFVGGWICLYAYGWCVKSSKQKQVFILPIDGYYTIGVDGVLFTFENEHFKRPHGVVKFVDQYGEDFPDKCIIHLRVISVLPKMYYIDNLSIAGK